ncbi:sulfotransferase family 2 domain-containing protein [Catalinimonas niigatensis]|uniref:sulfotransferase family 2 domain-containing protein n=1 Tax=Catalinimonas niigatensis TaxID=1397264 RepID=UPI002666BD95|nr:sulfotransferase family 2 domain-containing protein [Catalinimonas niigatensis]WPP52633.1 sulfotransferase family 2 domain-containing protein [Catalinimonas niigatensis]
MKKKTVFLHIPKTAGSTFNHIIQKQFKERSFRLSPDPQNYTEETTKCYLENSLDSFNKLNKDSLKKIEMFYGHILFGLHKKIDCQIKYITFVRNPFNRVISNFDWIRRLPSNRVKYRDISLKDYLTQDMDLAVSNLQTRMISGANLNSTVEAKHLDLAIDNLEKYFSEIFITERFDDSLTVLNKSYGWQSIYNEKKNVTENPTDQIDSDIIKIINEKNGLDIKLYEYCTKNFDERFKKLSQSNLKKILQFFKR